MERFKVKRKGISTKHAEQLRLGITVGELIYNMMIKDENDAVSKAIYEMSHHPKRTYLAMLHTIVKPRKTDELVDELT